LGVLSRFALTRTDLRVIHDVVVDRTPTQITIAHVFSWIGSGYVVLPWRSCAGRSSLSEGDARGRLRSV
jgi:hypothetical protein